MDKQKQIEEMARDFGESKGYACRSGLGCTCKECSLQCDCMPYSYAEGAYNAGYRKIPEGAVVLETSVYESLEVKNYRDVITERVRKETAEKFERLASEAFLKVNCIDLDEWNWYQDKLGEICKEITEGKV